MQQIRRKVLLGEPISRKEATTLFSEASNELLMELATLVRDRFHPPFRATYQKMAIVNYTNVCVARCDYCSFYRLPKQDGGYLLSTEQVFQKIDELIEHGGSMVGFNGGFHPKLRVEHYGKLFAAVRARYPGVEFYEMTVSEFMYVCKVSLVSYEEGAKTLYDYGVRWITGGGAEVLDESFRKRHSPLKYSVAEFYEAQRAILNAKIGSTATMVIGFDETLEERMNHLEDLRTFQEDTGRRLPSLLCWTYKPDNNSLGGEELSTQDYLRWLAICRIYLHNIPHLRTSVLTKNQGALHGLLYGADDFDLPTEDEVTQSAGATISHQFDEILQTAVDLGYTPVVRAPFPLPE